MTVNANSKCNWTVATRHHHHDDGQQSWRWNGSVLVRNGKQHNRSPQAQVKAAGGLHWPKLARMPAPTINMQPHAMNDMMRCLPDTSLNTVMARMPATSTAACSDNHQNNTSECDTASQGHPHHQHAFNHDSMRASTEREQSGVSTSNGKRQQYCIATAPWILKTSMNEKDLKHLN